MTEPHTMTDDEVEEYVRTSEGEPRFSCARSLLQVFPQVLYEYDFDTLPALDRPTVLDIGANVGIFSWFALMKWPGAKVIAYEPHPETCRDLRGNFGDLVEVHEQAVTHPKTTDRARLFEGVHARSECSLRDDVRWPHVSQNLERWTDVELVDAKHLPPCQVLKVDTEGNEVPILSGYKHLAQVVVMLVEVHAVGGDLNAEGERIQDIGRRAGLTPVDLIGTTIRFIRKAAAPRILLAGSNGLGAR